ncbi:MAG: acyl-CoA thioesterase II [Corynebacterium urealyticum]|uniref:Acyl-CoA thioesterase II n=1 Tax=Corynebacterium urealyticum TaxID=43771 RepID=A0A2W5AW10_9CORY|nr:MAG: acyl-CoA thioesterase II [Corynebacterium urealyticum]
MIPSTLSRTFGGQVAAQCLVAATRTVGAEYQVHSLHGYFVAAGRSEEPTLYIVERIRDGRSFCSRQVKAVQHGKPIFIMQASFHVRTDEGPEHSDEMASQQVVWFKSKARLPDDETFHVCTLAYMSDMTLLSSALVPHRGEQYQEASLDHAMWFLRPFRADEWLLYDQVSPSAHAGRAITHGRIFNQAGELVAVVTQEGLTRKIVGDRPAVPLKGFEGK